MNPFYTDETKIVVLDSFNRLSGGDADCILDMGYHLNNFYPFYHCQVIDFYGDTLNVSGTERLGNLDAFDIMESSYNSHEHYNGQTVVSGIHFSSARQYRVTEIHNRFVVKNFNGKQIRFAVSRGDGIYNGAGITGVRNWTLLLALTPIKESLQPIHKISSKYNESFTYCFSGVNRVDPNADIQDIHNCELLLRHVSSQYNEFFVDVRIIQHTRQLQNVSEEYLNIFISNWSEDYPDRQFIGSLFCGGNSGATNLFTANKGSDNAVFKIKNMKHDRIIRFEMLRSDYTRPTGLFLNGYNFYISCLITPIR